MHEDQSADEEKQHHSVPNPSLSRLAHHPAKRVSECGRHKYDGQRFEKVRQGRGVLIGMSPIRVKETAAARAEILDDLQCGYGALRYDLLRTFDSSDDGIVVEVHRNALPD